MDQTNAPATDPTPQPTAAEMQAQAAASATAAEHTPTREEAKAMFAENPGLWSVLTDEGTVTRDQC